MKCVHQAAETSMHKASDRVAKHRLSIRKINPEAVEWKITLDPLSTKAAAANSTNSRRFSATPNDRSVRDKKAEEILSHLHSDWSEQPLQWCTEKINDYQIKAERHNYQRHCIFILLFHFLPLWLQVQHKHYTSATHGSHLRPVEAAGSLKVWPLTSCFSYCRCSSEIFHDPKSLNRTRILFKKQKHSIIIMNSVLFLLGFLFLFFGIISTERNEEILRWLLF